MTGGAHCEHLSRHFRSCVAIPATVAIPPRWQTQNRAIDDRAHAVSALRCGLGGLVETGSNRGVTFGITLRKYGEMALQCDTRFRERTLRPVDRVEVAELET